MRGPALPSASGTVRAALVAALAGVAVLAPIRMARGEPKTRFAALPVGLDGLTGTGARVAAVAGPPEPAPAGPVVTSSFPMSHLGVRWRGSESAAIDIRLAGADGAFGPWRSLPADHDLDNGDGGPFLSELIRAGGARRAQLRAAGDAHDVELLAIDTEHGPRPYQVALGARPADAATSASASSSSSTSSSTTTSTAPVRQKPAVTEPAIITRKEWGADESIRKNNQKYAPITKL